MKAYSWTRNCLLGEQWLSASCCRDVPAAETVSFLPRCMLFLMPRRLVPLGPAKPDPLELGCPDPFRCGFGCGSHHGARRLSREPPCEFCLCAWAWRVGSARVPALCSLSGSRGCFFPSVLCRPSTARAHQVLRETRGAEHTQKGRSWGRARHRGGSKPWEEDRRTICGSGLGEKVLEAGTGVLSSCPVCPVWSCSLPRSIDFSQR